MTSYFDEKGIEDEQSSSKKKENADIKAARDFMAPEHRTRASDLEVEEDPRTSQLLSMFGGLRDQAGDREQLMSNLVERMLALDPAGGPKGNPPASKAFIDGLKAMNTPKEDLEEACGICLNHLPSVVKQLPCKHLFHPSCIVNWLKVSNTCPACRAKYPAEEERRPNPTQVPDFIAQFMPRSAASRPVVEDDEDEYDSMYG